MIKALELTEEEERELYESSLQLLLENKSSEYQNELLIMYKDKINQRKLDIWQIKAYMGKLSAVRMLKDLPLSNNRKQFEDQVECCNTIYWKGLEKSTNYCWRRLCPICSSIKMAKLINGYKEALAKKEKLWFLTLTVKTVNANQIRFRIEDMQRHFSRILKNNTEYNRRDANRNVTANGLRKLEVIVAKNKKYHCHYHIIIDSLEGAEFIKKQWLKKWGKDPYATISEKAQDIREVQDLEKGLIELSKYVSKPSYRQKETNKLGEEIRITSQEKDNILTALFKIRTTKPFGDIRKSKEEYESPESHRIYKPSRLKSNEHSWNKTNWKNQKTGETVGTIKIKPNEKDFDLLKSKLEKTAEDLQKLSEKADKQKESKNKKS